MWWLQIMKFISSFHPSLVETQKSSQLHPSPSPPPQGELVLCEQVDDLPEEHALECACELLLAIGSGARNGPRNGAHHGAMVPWENSDSIGWELHEGSTWLFYLVFPSWKMVVNLPNRAYYAHFLEDSSSWWWDDHKQKIPHVPWSKVGWQRPIKGDCSFPSIFIWLVSLICTHRAMNPIHDGGMTIAHIPCFTMARKTVLQFMTVYSLYLDW